MRNFALALIVALAAAPAAAQVHEHTTTDDAAPAQQGEHCALMMLGGAPIMGAMHAGPHAALQQREALNLNAEQAASLQALQAEMHAGVHGHLEAARTAQEDAAAMVAEGQFDAAAHEARLRAAADHVVQAQLAAAGVAAATQEILTAEQRAQLATGHAMMGGMDHGDMQHGGMDHSGMQHGEGMQHEGMMQGGMMGMMQQCMSMHGGGH
jgi:Spy/CpxP family protein refolding chaperone